jgi:hypothetical protein
MMEKVEMGSAPVRGAFTNYMRFFYPQSPTPSIIASHTRVFLDYPGVDNFIKALTSPLIKSINQLRSHTDTGWRRLIAEWAPQCRCC